MGFIFGGDTGIDYETLQRRRAVADAMQKRGTGIARNLGEGIGVLGNAVFGKIASNRLDRQEAEGRKSASEAFQAAFSASRQRRAQAQAAPQPGALGPVETQPLAPPDPMRSDVMKALVQQESGGDPSAVSPKGAGGLAQIMPATARDPGYGVPSIYDLSSEMGGSTPPPAEAGDEAMTAWLADPQNAHINERFGSMYLDAMMEKNGGNRDHALASYNAGPGAVEQYGGIPPYEETQNYVKAINARLGRSEQAPQANPEPVMSSPQPEQGLGGLSPELLELAGNQFLSPQQQAVVQALLQQEFARMNPEQMSPYQTAQLDLAERRFQAQLSGKLKTGTSINVNTGSNGIDYGKPPTDMAWARNPDGSVKLDDRGIPVALPIDNSKLATAADKVEKADTAREEGKQKTAGIQLEEIDRAKAKIKESPTWTTGFFGDILKDWGGTKAKDVSVLLETVQANIGFDRLNQMRAESPTGGALGNVTERELKFLQSVAGSLDQAQTSEQLLETMARLEAEIGKIVHGPDWSPGGGDDDDVSDLLEKY